MATSTSDMPLSGGNPALDLANTVDSRRGRWGPDLLHSYDDVIALAQRLALVDEAQAGELSAIAKAQPGRAVAAAKETVRLREAIYAIFLAEDAQQPYPAAAFETIRNKARRARGRQVLTETGDGFRWLLPLTDLTDLTGMFAVAAAELITGRDDRRPVRECKGDSCGWLFLDTSKSGRRLWCSEATCGTHARVKRFRGKHIRDYSAA
jgi:predicted RNA-binding Zn ribbon-like protein